MDVSTFQTSVCLYFAALLVGSDTFLSLDRSNMLECLHCEKVRHWTDCLGVTRCLADQQACFMEEEVTDSGLTVYSAGCRSKKTCDEVKCFDNLKAKTNRTIHFLGKTLDCHHCCHGDFCNIYGCPPNEGIPKQSLCMKCPSVTDPLHCTTLDYCSPDEQCIQNPVYHSGGLRFELGCETKTMCDALLANNRKRLDHFGGEIGVGHVACCSGHLCNRDYPVQTGLTKASPYVNAVYICPNRTNFEFNGEFNGTLQNASIILSNIKTTPSSIISSAAPVGCPPFPTYCPIQCRTYDTKYCLICNYATCGGNPHPSYSASTFMMISLTIASPITKSSMTSPTKSKSTTAMMTSTVPSSTSVSHSSPILFTSPTDTLTTDSTASSSIISSAGTSRKNVLTTLPNVDKTSFTKGISTGNIQPERSSSTILLGSTTLDPVSSSAQENTDASSTYANSVANISSTADTTLSSRASSSGNPTAGLIQSTTQPYTFATSSHTDSVANSSGTTGTSVSSHSSSNGISAQLSIPSTTQTNIDFSSTNTNNFTESSSTSDTSLSSQSSTIGTQTTLSSVSASSSTKTNLNNTNTFTTSNFPSKPKMTTTNIKSISGDSVPTSISQTSYTTSNKVTTKSHVSLESSSVTSTTPLQTSAATTASMETTTQNTVSTSDSDLLSTYVSQTSSNTERTDSTTSITKETSTLTKNSKVTEDLTTTASVTVTTGAFPSTGNLITPSSTPACDDVSSECAYLNKTINICLTNTNATAFLCSAYCGLCGTQSTKCNDLSTECPLLDQKESICNPVTNATLLMCPKHCGLCGINPIGKREVSHSGHV